MKKLLTVALMVLASAGCADENDPATWVKRLDDPAQRAAAVKRLGSFYEDALSKASGPDKRADPNVKKVVDVIIEPMAKTYVGGGLDDQTRKELMSKLANMHDPRADIAFAKAFNEYEHPKLDEDVKSAAEGVGAMAKAGVKLDQPVIDALWTCFIKYKPSVTNSIQGTQNIHDAILAIHDPSYGDKAIAALKAPIVLDDNPSEQGTKKVNDGLEFWQTTAIQVIKELRYKPAAKALVAVVMTRNKLGLARVAKAAILRMSRDAEPFLVAGLTGSDPDLKALQGDWDNKGYVPNLVDVLGYTALDSSRDAIIAYVPSLDNDTNRAAAATMLIWFPPTPQLVATFKGLYDKLPPIADKGGADTGTERAGLLGISSEFFDESLASWALTQGAAAKGTNMLAAKAGALQSAIKLMLPADKASVEKGLANLDSSGLTAKEKQDAAQVHAVYTNASLALDKCGTNAGCYVQILDEAVPETPNGNWKAIKAAHMAAQLGNDQTRKDIIARIPKVTNAGARLAMAVAVNHLAPKGDKADGDALDKIVDDDTNHKVGGALSQADDALTNVALMLRARAGQ